MAQSKNNSLLNIPTAPNFNLMLSRNLARDVLQQLDEIAKVNKDENWQLELGELRTDVENMFDQLKNHVKLALK